MIGLALTGCTDSRDDTAYLVQRLALDTLFNGREHARELVIWSSENAGPALERIPTQQQHRLHPVDIRRLAPTLPASAIDEPALTRLFRDNPDGWAEFFRLFPRSPGLVELSPVHFSSGDRIAETFVGRSCGEHCRNVWRVVARRNASGIWRVTDLQWIRIPQA